MPSWPSQLPSANWEARSKPVHANLAITIAQYKYFINDVVVPALTTSGVNLNDIANCFAPGVLDTNFLSTVVTWK